jgi:hypothetical protein
LFIDLVFSIFIPADAGLKIPQLAEEEIPLMTGSD